MDAKTSIDTTEWCDWTSCCRAICSRCCASSSSYRMRCSSRARAEESSCEANCWASPCATGCTPSGGRDSLVPVVACSSPLPCCGPSPALWRLAPLSWGGGTMGASGERPKNLTGFSSAPHHRDHGNGCTGFIDTSRGSTRSPALQMPPAHLGSVFQSPCGLCLCRACSAVYCLLAALLCMVVGGSGSLHNWPRPRRTCDLVLRFWPWPRHEPDLARAAVSSPADRQSCIDPHACSVPSDLLWAAALRLRGLCRHNPVAYS